MSKKSVKAAQVPEGAVIGTFEGKCADSVENNNVMTLPKELWQKLFDSDEFKHFIELGHYIGFLGHPEDPGCQEFKDACIVMKEGHVDPDGQVYGKFDLVNTPVGRIVKALIDAGVQFGISVRGAGDVASDGYVDPDTFIFRGFDLVAFPAYDSAIPTFNAVAASSDPKMQSKYKAVCAAIDTNIKDVKSTVTLDLIKSQFNPNSDTYKKIVKCETESALDIRDQKIAAMTQLYVEAMNENARLKDEMSRIRVSAQSKVNRSKRVLASIQRIMNDQLTSVQKSQRDTQARYQTAVAANSKLKDQLSSMSDENLKYKQKVNASDSTLKEKDRVIASLESKLSKTVESVQRTRGTSNRDASKIRRLEDKVEACQRLVDEYQEAFADLYATALGVNLNEITITASTSVEDLKTIIRNGTSTSGMPAVPAMEPIEVLEDEDDPSGMYLDTPTL